MELELGLKFTRAADEFTSDFQIKKDSGGTLFVSRETNTMFVLTAHLKGYKRGNIKIDINEDGSLIGISGEKHIKETVIVWWKVYKKDAEVKGYFKKVFRIPDGVILDKIKAKFQDDESILTITMPKKVEGIRGTCIEEVMEKDEIVKEGSENLQSVDEQSSEKGSKLKGKMGEDDKNDEMPTKDGEEGETMETQMCKDDKENRRKVDEIEERIEPKEENGRNVDEIIESKEDNQRKVDEIKEKVETKEENQRNVDKIEERIETKEDNRKNEDEIEDKIETKEEYRRNEDENEEGIESKVDQEIGKEKDVVEDEKEQLSTIGTCVEARSNDEEAESGKGEGKMCNMCIPIVAGSTLLLSFVVFVIQIIRSKNRSSTKRD